jgi:hypothetical protein
LTNLDLGKRRAGREGIRIAVIVAVGHCDPAASLDTLLSRDIRPTENGSPRAQANVPVQPF